MVKTHPEKRLIGYARVSTYGQTLESQLEQLRAAGCNSRNIYREKVTGARPVDPGPKPAATDEIAIAVIEQRPILNTTGSLSLDLSVEFRLDLGFSEFAARINERCDGGIAPQFHREGLILDLP
jgi:hypothetical protein